MPDDALFETPTDVQLILADKQQDHTLDDLRYTDPFESKARLMQRIIIEPFGGLANRVRAIVSAQVLAEELDAALDIAWDTENDLCRCRLEDLFEDLTSVPLSACEEPGVYSFGYVQPGRYTLPASESVGTIHFRSLITFKLTSMPLEVYLTRCREKIQQLQPRPDIAARVLDVPSTAVGLHIRRSDHWRSTRYSPLRLFVDRMGRHLADDPDCRFYAASDSPPVHELLDRRFGGSVISYPKRDYSRMSAAGIADALVDLLCLAQTRLIYGSHMSSFGRMAAELSGALYETLHVRRVARHWDGRAIDRGHDRLLRWDERRRRWRGKRGGWFRFRPDHLVIRAYSAYVHSGLYQMRQRGGGTIPDRGAKRLFDSPGMTFDDPGGIPPR